MKIKEKLFMLLCVTILILTITFSCFNLLVFNNQYQQEQLNSAYSTIKQIMLSYTYNTNEISRYIYESCRSENASACLSGTLHTPDISLGKVLRTIAANQKAIKTGIFVANDNTFYYMDYSDETLALIQLWEDGIFDTQDDVHWFHTMDGKIYIRRNIYRMNPYEVVGSCVFEIDNAYLCSIIGVDNLRVGSLCIIDRYGNFRLISGEQSIERFQELIGSLRSGKTLAPKIMFDGENYHIITANNVVGSEKAIYMVAESDLLQPYYEVRNFIYHVACLVLVVAWIVSYILADLFTKNIRSLKKQINDIGTSHAAAARITSVSKQDEIGELANDFNRLLDRINDLYETNLKESQSQQNTKYEMLHWQYRALQSQVSPHFLCNILSSISMLAAVGNYKEIQSLTVNASRYLRRNLNCSSSKSSTIQEELKISQEYVNLASAMSAVPILLQTYCAPELEHILIPSYLLQPLVENSIKHGLPPRNMETLIICIHAEPTQPGRIKITVSDNGCGFNDQLVERLYDIEYNEELDAGALNFGLEGIIRRMKLQYRDRFRLRMDNKPEGGAIVDIEFPICFDD